MPTVRPESRTKVAAAPRSTLSSGWFSDLPSRMNWSAVLVALAVAIVLGLVIGTGLAFLIESLVEQDQNQIARESAGPLAGSIFGTFFGFFGGAIVLRRRTTRDPLLHGAALVVLATVGLFALTALDALLGFPSNSLFGERFDHGLGVMQFSTAWVMPVIAIPAVLLGIAIVPARGVSLLDENNRAPETETGL